VGVRTRGGNFDECAPHRVAGVRNLPRSSGRSFLPWYRGAAFDTDHHVGLNGRQVGFCVGYLVFIGQNSKSIDGLPKWEHIVVCFPFLSGLALVRVYPLSLPAWHALLRQTPQHTARGLRADCVRAAPPKTCVLKVSHGQNAAQLRSLAALAPFSIFADLAIVVVRPSEIPRRRRLYAS
jgi:hypothetical protein